MILKLKDFKLSIIDLCHNKYEYNHYDTDKIMKLTIGSIYNTIMKEHNYNLTINISYSDKNAFNQFVGDLTFEQVFTYVNLWTEDLRKGNNVTDLELQNKPIKQYNN